MTLAAGLVLVGAVTLLRTSAGVVPSAPAPPPRPASAVTALTVPGVTVEDPPGPPATPAGAEFVPGEETPVLRWSPAAGATAYDIRWHADGHAEHRRLSTVPRVALAGVPAGSSVSVAVRAVDALGRRSAPLRLASGNLRGRLERADPLSFVDRFSSVAAPDRSRWRVPEGATACLSRGSDEERGLLVVDHGCGTVSLRPAPLLGRGQPGGGRLVVVADGPPPGAELVVALMPGTVAGLPPGALDRAAPAAGTATADPALPPGTVLLRITEDGPALTLGVPAHPPGTAAPARPAMVGAPTRWELRLDTGAVRVLRDDVPVLDTAVAVPWQQATAVLAVRPAAEHPQRRTLLDAVRMTTAPQPAPAARVLPPDAATELAGATAVRLLGWVRGGTPTTVALGDGPVVPLVGAGAAGAVVADLPPPVTAGPVALRITGGELVDAVLEVTRPPELTTSAAGPRLARIAPPPPPVPVPRLTLLPGDRPVLEIVVDATGQGAAAGYVGLEVDVGSRQVLGLPTARDGPAGGGVYRIGLDHTVVAAGTVAVRVVAADRTVAPGWATLPAA